MAQRIVIHAGQHKTGTTSIQHYLQAHHARLSELGVFAFPSWSGDLGGPEENARTRNAGAVAHALLRPRLMTPGRLRKKFPLLEAVARAAGIRRVNQFLRAVPQETVVISAEAFAFLRKDGEFQRLEKLCQGMEWSAVMFLREPSSWRESWRQQITHGGLIDFPGAVDGEGIFDLGEDTWLTDHEAIRSFWQGRCEFLSYEEALTADGSVFPAFLESIGLDPSQCPDWEGFRLNNSADKNV
jgi:hypothetical protein